MLTASTARSRCASERVWHELCDQRDRPAPFERLFGLPDEALAAAGAIRVIANAQPGFPCRITLADAAPGEALLLVNHEHLPVDTPYRSRHAIYVREGR